MQSFVVILVLPLFAFCNYFICVFFQPIPDDVAVKKKLKTSGAATSYLWGTLNIKRFVDALTEVNIFIVFPCKI